MDFYRLTSTNDVLCNKAFDLYKASFPEHEQRLFEDQIVALNHSEYHCDIILEIDPPVESISIRRKNFYMRPKQNVPHELVIMSFPRRISELEYSQFNEYLVKTIMKSDQTPIFLKRKKIGVFYFSI
ncbi:GNAT family acetyltransferase [Brevibacillus laterosporus]|uniref:GNAT family acetyltransferase n=1 Tax=Brevibacillus laterosporus TaxID=1465 RepID=UPI000C7876E9|nr:GNAT family acetyltransferase [Brevibacillus laterosporus]AUM65255.1 GNAT family acetyltransferase [Brevibacillus laterosporus]